MEERALQRSTPPPNAHLNGEGGYKREQQASQPGRATHTHVSPTSSSHRLLTRSRRRCAQHARGPAPAQRCVPPRARARGGWGNTGWPGVLMALDESRPRHGRDTKTQHRESSDTSTARSRAARVRTMPSKAPMPQAIQKSKQAAASAATRARLFGWDCTRQLCSRSPTDTAPGPLEQRGVAHRRSPSKRACVRSS